MEIDEKRVDGYNEAKESKLKEVAIFDIAGGVQISTRDVGAEIIIDDITDTVQRYPGAGSSILRKTLAAFKNGFTEDLDMKRRIQLMYGDFWKETFGYACFLVDKDKNLQALHPLTYQMGFIIDRIDEDGNPARIRMQYKASEKKEPDVIKFYYAWDGTEGFFMYRKFGGLLEVRGPPSLLTLVDSLRVQNALYLKYMEHAEWQAISHPVFKIRKLDKTKYDRIKSDITAPRTEKAVIIDSEDDFYYDGPMAGAGTWNPIEMMRYGDNLIARETSLSMFQLTGDPMGYLSASQSNRAEWYDSVSYYQTIYLPQLREVFVALGLTEETSFNNAYEPVFEAKMEMIKLFREATDGLVDPEQQIDYMNDLLGLEEDKKFNIDPDFFEMRKLTMQGQQNGFNKKNNNQSDKEKPGE